jgi:hypothetical protein
LCIRYKKKKNPWGVEFEENTIEEDKRKTSKPKGTIATE